MSSDKTPEELQQQVSEYVAGVNEKVKRVNEQFPSADALAAAMHKMSLTISEALGNLKAVMSKKEEKHSSRGITKKPYNHEKSQKRRKMAKKSRRINRKSR